YLDMYLPEIANLQNLVERPFYKEDLWEHTLNVVENTPPEYLLRLAGLFHHLENYKEALSRFRFSMVLGKGGKGGEKDLVWLIKNHKQGPLTFSQELRERKEPQTFEGKIRRFIWEHGWTGRFFHAERVKNILILWKADYYGYKKAQSEEEKYLEGSERTLKPGESKYIDEKYKEEGKYLEKLLSFFQEETEKIQNENEIFQWELLEEFALQRKIKGREWGAFKEYLRKKMILEKVPALTQELLAHEYKVFRKKKY
ncbi:MAG: hypothetical protein GX958_09320, partial [Desulfitobacterium sp.]|nr:hypothetical protein [Desulfitobacterium sp.]